MNKINKILADGIENCVEGEHVFLNDSTQAYLKGLKMMGKTEQVKTNGYQLFDASIVPDIDNNEIKIINNGDGSFTISGNGTLTENVSSIMELDNATTLRLVKSGQINLITEQVSIPYVCAYFCKPTGETLLRLNNSSKASYSATMTDEILNTEGMYLRIGFYAVAGKTITPCTIKPMLYQDGDGTWEPFTSGIPAPNVNYPQPLNSVGDDGGVDVSICGKNMVDIHNPYQVLGGVSYTANDGIATVVRGTAVYAPSIYFDLGKYRSWVGKTLTISVILHEDTGTNGLKNLIYINGAKGTNNQVLIIKATEFKSNNKVNFTVTIPENLEAESLRIRLYLQNLKNSDEKAVFSNFQVELGEASTSYEPYKPIQTLTIDTSPNGLPAVPVSSDGNYTDASGQQWVCDEIDFNRGVYVQRVNEYVVTGNENWVVSHYQNSTDGRIRFDSSFAGLDAKATGDSCLCTHWVFNGINTRNVESVWVASHGLRILTNCFSTVDELKIALKAQYNSGTPVTFKYPIATPIETPLSEAEINAYKALHTHYPNTSIHNSDNAHMVVDYVADTKNYIDNKIASEVAKLSAAIITE